MSRKNVLYIGNKIGGHRQATVTTLDVLSGLLRHEGYEVVTASSKRNKLLRLIDMLWTTFRYRKWADVVLIDTYSTLNFYYAVSVANMCRLVKLPYIPILHGGNLPERLVKNKALCYKLFNGAKINVSPSAYLMNAFHDASYTNLEHLPNSIELDRYPFIQRQSVQPKILWVRAFAEIYNPMMALRVLETVRKTRPSATMCMIGPDKDGSLAACKNYAEEHQLQVTFTGKLSKEEWTKKSEEFDVFINTTNVDNAPVSVIEAMALGLPLISTKVGGIPYLVDDTKNALLTEPTNAEQMAAMIETLCDKPDLVKLLSVEGRKRAEKFGWNAIKPKWFALLES